jgi:hypothetical protein
MYSGRKESGRISTKQIWNLIARNLVERNLV